ncbi:hypothetical protein K6W21_19200 [Burkholderia latens]|uniref:hypothetical protein n=1 Tax=Burkholderia latens TaxID=488446 RepID=UPI001C97B5DF|nr:hypothetical protein [Burkholderia latens]MBY4696200.1 hypothetical protein [Burkholderia latens]
MIVDDARRGGALIDVLPGRAPKAGDVHAAFPGAPRAAAALAVADRFPVRTHSPGLTVRSVAIVRRNDRRGSGHDRA